MKLKMREKKKLEDNYTHKDYYLWLKAQGVNLKAVTCHNNIDKFPCHYYV